MGKLSIRDLELSGKRVFIRVDFNVPLDGGKVGDDTRIRETLPTLQLAISKGARVVLASHLGRPKGKPDPKYSLKPVAAHLAGLLGKPVEFAEDCVGAAAEEKSRALANGGVLLLQNVRYHKEEEANDEGFSRQLAALCDGIFVLDAFGSSHRAHASVVGITKFVQKSAAGLLMERELTFLGKAISNPERPFVAMLGGAKVSDKIEVVENLMRIADAMLIGGGMAYTFLKAQGLPVGNSLVEADKIDLAKKIDFGCGEKQVSTGAAGGSRRRGGVQGRHRDENRFHRADAGRLDGTRYRTRHGDAILRRASFGQDDCVERADGRLRVSGVCKRHRRGRESRGEGDVRRARRPLSAEEIRLQRCTRPASRIKFRIFRPAAGLRSNF